MCLFSLFEQKNPTASKDIPGFCKKKKKKKRSVHQKGTMAFGKSPIIHKQTVQSILHAPQLKGIVLAIYLLKSFIIPIYT